MSPYHPEDINRVRAAVDIVEVIKGYVNLKSRGGHDWWGRCPFHTEKTPSFHVRADWGMFHCFGCGKGGNVFNFIMEMERISFPEAVKLLADKVGITLREEAPRGGTIRSEQERIAEVTRWACDYYHRQLLSPEPIPEVIQVREYLHRRGLADSTIHRFMLGWAPTDSQAILKSAHTHKITPPQLLQAGLIVRQREGTYRDRFSGRITFPITDLMGRPIALGGRLVEGITPSSETAKYINSPENALYRKGDHLYGLYQAREAIKEQGLAWVVEGYIDLLAMVEAGFINVVASLGTSLTERQVRLLGRFTDRVGIVYDSDSAGVAAAMRAAERLVIGGLEVELVPLPPGEDPDSLLRKEGPEALKRALEGRVSFVQFHLLYGPGGEITSVAELVRSARNLLSTIARITDPLQQEVLLQQLSSLTRFSLDSLKKAMVQVSDHRLDDRPYEPPSSTITWSNEHIPERDLIRTLIAFPPLIEEAVKHITPAELTHPSLRVIYQAMETHYFSGTILQPGDLTHHLGGDPQWAAFISEAEFNPIVPDLSKAEEALRQCLLRVRLASRQRECEELNKEISKVSQLGGSITPIVAKLNQTLQEIALLQRELRTPRPT